jgi:hypothetical protein
MSRAELVESLRMAKQDVMDLQAEQARKLDAQVAAFKQQREEQEKKFREDSKAEEIELLKQIAALNNSFQQELLQKENRFKMNLENEQEQLQREAELSKIEWEQQFEQKMKDDDLRRKQIAADFEVRLKGIDIETENVNLDRSSM